MKTLVVDDELVSRTKLKTIMDMIGVCVEAEDGRAGLEAFKQAWAGHEPFDLICLDVKMPDMDGTEVLFEIRLAEKEMKVAREKPARILMITSSSDKDTVITSIQAGCDGYVVKPFQANQIFEKLKKLGLKF